jgi:hypothetical protein
LEPFRQRAATLGHAIWVFLDRGPFAAKTPIGVGFVWISLDSLARNEPYQ